MGYRITEEARVFGGDTFTTSDIVTALGKARVGDPEKVKDLDLNLLEPVYSKIIALAEDVIDRMKTSSEPIPVIRVGGGSILLPDELQGASEVLKLNSLLAARHPIPYLKDRKPHTYDLIVQQT